MQLSRVIITSLAAVLLLSCTSEAQKTDIDNPKVKSKVKIAMTISDPCEGPEKPTVDEKTNAQIMAIFEQGKSQKLNLMPIGERVVGYGKLLLGKPYIDKTLEVNPDQERLVCNLDGLDCVTFFENAWNFARLSHHPLEGRFECGLSNLRYRDGKLEGYASRLHYTTDYFYDNQKRGHLKEMTTSIGGVYAIIEDKPIDFMSNHPASYKQIENNEAEWKRIDFYEREIANRGGFYYIKKENVAKIEKGIEDGDLIGITTSIKGIDCSHTGIAIRGKNGRIHLMHASLTQKKVVISDVPLADYLAGNSKQTGIIVYRPLEVEKK